VYAGIVMDQSEKFWDKIAERYSNRPVTDEDAYQKKLQVTRGYLGPNMEVMEFGCGTGSTAIALAPCVKQIVAVDFSSKMVEIAQRKADAKKIGNVTFKRAPIDNFSVPDQTLDVVLGNNVLHLLKNKEEVISRVHKMLKPGGVFVTSTACLGDMMILFRIIAPIGSFLGLFPSVKIFTIKEFENSLTETGFELDYKWQAGKNKPVFIVVKKTA
jgi:ubiquinone/menaquinone biosynthesis C-methylase UbiE